MATMNGYRCQGQWHSWCGLSGQNGETDDGFVDKELDGCQ